MQSKLIYPYCVFPLQLKYSTLEIQLFQLFYCGWILCTIPACFGIFYQSTMVPTLDENSKLFVVVILSNVHVWHTTVVYFVK